MGHGFGFGTWRRRAPSFVGPFDAFEAALELLFGPHRALSSYTGPCWRVQRSIDSGEEDVGFDGNGWVDKEWLQDVAGGGSLAIVRDYDKTGKGRDGVASSAPFRPRCVLNGVVDVGPNGHPCAVWDGVNDALLLQNMTQFMRSADNVTFAIISQTSITTQQILTQALLPTSPNNIQLIQYYLNGTTLRTQARLNPAAGVNTNADVTITAGSWVRGISRVRYVDGFVDTAVNGTVSSVSASTAGRTPDINMSTAIPLGSNQAASSFFNGRIATGAAAKASLDLALFDAALAKVMP